MINLIAKAYKWNKSLKSSRNTIASIAEKEGLTPSHVGRIMRLKFLAPDIIEAILEGKQPRSLLAIDLMRNNIPNLWQEQRNVFGFIAAK
jgi:hypothetical protein